MQGTILNAAGQGGQGVIKGDDGVEYTYTSLGWRDAAVTDAPGMKVDFEPRGAHAVGIYPVPGAAPPATFPSAPANPAPPQQPVQPPAAPVPPQQPVQQPPAAPAPPQQPVQPPAAPVPPQQPVQQPPAAPVPPQQFVQQPPPVVPAVPATPVPPQQPFQAPVAPVGQMPMQPPGMAQPPYAPPQPPVDGSLGAAVGWMLLLDIICSIGIGLVGWIPIIGWILAIPLLFVPGFVGGRKADTLKNAMLAVLILNAAYTAITVIIIAAVVEILRRLPIIGTVVDSLLRFAGGEGIVAFVILALLFTLINAIPAIIGALIGSSTKPKRTYY